MLVHCIYYFKERKTVALMKMQVLFSDEHRKVSGLWVSVLQGKDSLLKSDWCVISTGIFNPSVSGTQQFFI